MADLPDVRDDSHPDAVIAGTLCLMSCYAQHPLPAFAARVADNLHRLAGAATLTAEFRAVCRRMAHRWSSIEDEARDRAKAGASPDPRTLQ